MASADETPEMKARRLAEKRDRLDFLISEQSQLVQLLADNDDAADDGAAGDNDSEEEDEKGEQEHVELATVDRERIMDKFYSIKEIEQIISGTIIRWPKQGKETGKAKQRPRKKKRTSKQPLLSLPAEIRNRIYEYALGGRRTHVERYRVQPPQPLLFRLCRIEATDDNRCRRDRRDADELPCRLFNGRVCVRDNRCRTPRRKIIVKADMTLDLLLTCRQIYKEAALIPFACNTFILHTGNRAFETFSNSFSSQQLAAITDLTLVLDGRKLPALSLCSVESLPSLTKLAIRLDMYQLMDLVFERLEVFGRGPAPLKEVEIDVHVRNKDGDDDVQGAVEGAGALGKVLLGAEADAENEELEAMNE